MDAKTSTLDIDLQAKDRPYHVIIATTQPELFKPNLLGKQGKLVTIVKTSTAAIEALESQHCDAFYADFRQLDDRWTGQKFLRYIRDRSDFSHIEFYLMAEHWHETQEQWAVKCGATGMVKRSPHVLAARILGVAPQMSITLELQLDAVDDVFGRFSGPMRTIHVQAARDAIESGYVEPSKDAYIHELASKFSLAERRDAFMKALQVEADKGDSPETTQPGDPWMTEVNRVFKRYAGALGARIIISKALEDLEQRGNYDRSFYVSGLSAGLVNPVRRTDFISAARHARLIS